MTLINYRINVLKKIQYVSVGVYPKNSNPNLVSMLNNNNTTTIMWLGFTRVVLLRGHYMRKKRGITK